MIYLSLAPYNAICLSITHLNFVIDLPLYLALSNSVVDLYIIANIEGDGDHYKKATLLYQLKDNDPLLAKLRAAGEA